MPDKRLLNEDTFFKRGSEKRWSKHLAGGEVLQMACCPGLVTIEPEIKTLTMSQILNDRFTGWQPLPMSANEPTEMRPKKEALIT